MTRTRLRQRPIPRFGLTITDDAWLATRYNNLGRPEATYAVEPAAVVTALAVGGIGTGLLPEHALFSVQHGNVVTAAAWFPPRPRTLRYPKRTFKDVPMPGLVLVGTGSVWRLFAAPERPQTPDSELFNAPVSNVGEDGSICDGHGASRVQFPIAKWDTIAQAWALFWESGFTHDLDHGRIGGRASLRHVLESLQGKREFPTNLLTYSGTDVANLMKGKVRA